MLRRNPGSSVSWRWLSLNLTMYSHIHTKSIYTGLYLIVNNIRKISWKLKCKLWNSWNTLELFFNLIVSCNIDFWQHWHTVSIPSLSEFVCVTKFNVNFQNFRCFRAVLFFSCWQGDSNNFHPFCLMIAIESPKEYDFSSTCLLRLWYSFSAHMMRGRRSSNDQWRTLPCSVYICMEHSNYMERATYPL